MTSEMLSSRRSGSSGPRPMISSVICSSIRTRSARVRASPSSSMTRPKISSIWRRTSTWLDRSSFGSRSWITRFWIRNLTSRKDSRTGVWVISRADGGADGVWAPPDPLGVVAGVCDDPSDPGRALSMRFRRLICYTPWAADGRCDRCHVIATRTTTSSVRPSLPPARRTRGTPSRRPPGPAAGRPGTPAPRGWRGRTARPG